MEKQEFINKINERLNNGNHVRITYNKGAKVAGYLGWFRKNFPNNYVGKESFGGQVTITIYAGDKETQKFLNKPIKFETSRQQFNREFKKDMENLRNTYNT